jgi:hypothetical protein
MGDVLMCYRFAALLKPLFAKIGFTAHAPLAELLQANAPENVEILRWIKGPAPVEEYTHTIYLMDLPAAFAATPSNVPSSPYLIAPPVVTDSLCQVLAQLQASSKLKVGFVWQGGKISVANGRDIPFEECLPLLKDAELGSKVQWVSLQKDIVVNGLENFINAMTSVTSFADTASLVSSLDLVISVDTSVAHLAGAMGKPIWLLNRFESEWRWMHGKSTTPWYPSMRIFNEPRPGDWPSVIRELGQTLRTNLSNVRGD